MKRAVKVIVCLWVILGVSAIYADTFTSVRDGLWHGATTWDLAGNPEEADDVIVTNAVSLNQSAHAESLSINGAIFNAASQNLVIDSVTDIYAGGNLRNGSLTLGTLNLSNGRAEGGNYSIGTVNLSGGIAESNTMDISTFNWTGGRINDSQLNVIDGVFNSSSTLYLDNSPLTVTGTFSQGNTGIIRLYGTGSIITN